MFFLIPMLALLAGLAAALPTNQISADGAGATIYTSKHFAGRSTAIPTNNWCTDLSNLFGDFDGKVRSLRVNKGYCCQFYRNQGCPASAPASQKLVLGSRDAAVAKKDLGALDFNLHSAYCAVA